MTSREKRTLAIAALLFLLLRNRTGAASARGAVQPAGGNVDDALQPAFNPDGTAFDPAQGRITVTDSRGRSAGASVPQVTQDSPITPPNPAGPDAPNPAEQP